jgi:hypothetical protein
MEVGYLSTGEASSSGSQRPRASASYAREALAQIIGHAGRQAALAASLDGVGGQGVLH